MARLILLNKPYGVVCQFSDDGSGRPTLAAFVDVPAGSAFAREIAWLKQRGITKGWPDGTYRPYGLMNRDATAAFIQRAVVEAGVTFGRG